MNYQQNDCGVKGSGYSKNCIADVIWRILQAQREVAGVSENGCSTSCDQSIEDLLSPSKGGPSKHTTIPFMLTNKDGSSFFGSGFTSGGGSRHEHFYCVESPVFKVREFIKGSNNCVRLELLTPVYHHGPHPREADDGVETRSSHHQSTSGSVCGYFGNYPIDNFCHTGVCITVDLNCFCAISCLDPITPANK